jgi:membrane protein required for beta-lactamase induction
MEEASNQFSGQAPARRSVVSEIVNLLKWVCVTALAAPVVLAIVGAASCVVMVWLSYTHLIDPFTDLIRKEPKQEKKEEKKDLNWMNLVKMYGKQGAEIIRNNREQGQEIGSN